MTFVFKDALTDKLKVTGRKIEKVSEFQKKDEKK